MFMDMAVEPISGSELRPTQKKLKVPELVGTLRDRHFVCDQLPHSLTLRIRNSSPTKVAVSSVPRRISYEFRNIRIFIF
jgi:hypothetical protein